MNYEEFIRDRITELRIQANLSEYQLSADLGRSHGYINSITRGKVKPSLAQFLSICECLNVTPFDFFNSTQQTPALTRKIINNLKDLSEADLLVINTVAEHLQKINRSR